MQKRNYRGEYENYHKQTDQKKRRASRNNAGRVKKGDGKDVAHKNGNPRDNKKKNLTVKPKSINRSFARTSKARKVNRRA